MEIIVFFSSLFAVLSLFFLPSNSNCLAITTIFSSEENRLYRSVEHCLMNELDTLVCMSLLEMHSSGLSAGFLCMSLVLHYS